MRRRDFIAGTLAAMAWPLAAGAQQPAMPVIGFLNSGVRASVERALVGYRQGLAETGFVEGQNIAIDYRVVEGRDERLPGLAAELVRRRVSLIAANGGEAPAKAAAAATRTIPIVFSVPSDPVSLGLVASFNRPGSNATGMAILVGMMDPKRLEILHELVPGANSVGILTKRGAPDGGAEAAARRLKLDPYVISVGDEGELDAAYAAFSERKVGAVLVADTESTLQGWSPHVSGLAARFALPTMYGIRSALTNEPLISYGPNIIDVYRQCAIYAGRILKGEKPDNLPVFQPTKFDLVINLKTAKALDLVVPPTLLARADQVIE
jgi:putative ABC transport system substrate-binding protein